MIKENQIQRRTTLDAELLKLCYQRRSLQRQLEDLEREILMIEGAVAENDALRRDIGTEEVLNKAKEPEPQKGG